MVNLSLFFSLCSGSEKRAAYGVMRIVRTLDRGQQTVEVPNMAIPG